MTRILVLGGTGKVGRRVTRALQANGATAIPASRSTDPAFSWDQSATWRPALDGVDAVFILLPEGVELDRRFLDLIEGSNVQRVTLFSSRAVEEMHDERLLAAERMVGELALPWCIVRSDWFDQNFDEGFLHDAVVSGTIAIPVGSMRQGFVDLDDVADVIAKTLLSDNYSEQTIEVTGPELLTFEEAACAIARAGDLEVHHIGTPDAYVETMTSFGAPREQADEEARTFSTLAAGGDARLTDAVERIAGHPPRPFLEYATAAAQRGAWDED